MFFSSTSQAAIPAVALACLKTNSQYTSYDIIWLFSFLIYLVMIHREVPLLLFKLGHQSFSLFFDGDILLEETVFCFQLLIILALG